jgi:hypothetical protein
MTIGTTRHPVGGRHRASERLCAAIDGAAAGRDGRTVRMGDVLAALGPHSLALALMLLTLPALVPSPGLPLGALSGAALAILALRIMVLGNAARPPAWIERLNVRRDLLNAASRRLIPVLRRVEALLRPRLRVLSSRRAVRLWGAVVLVHAVLIALPIPFGNLLPGVAVLVLACGLLARDGLALLASLAVSLAALGGCAALAIGAWSAASGALGF